MDYGGVASMQPLPATLGVLAYNMVRTLLRQVTCVSAIGLNCSGHWHNVRRVWLAISIACSRACRAFAGYWEGQGPATAVSAAADDRTGPSSGRRRPDPDRWHHTGRRHAAPGSTECRHRRFGSQRDGGSSVHRHLKHPGARCHGPSRQDGTLLPQSAAGIGSSDKANSFFCLRRAPSMPSTRRSRRPTPSAIRRCPASQM